MFDQKELTREIESYLIANQETIYRLAYSYVKHPEDALDVVQESIIKAISSVNTLRDSQGMKSWVYRIVINTALDFLRKQKRLVVVDSETISTYIDEPAAGYEEGSDLDLASALEKLPPAERGRIILRYYEDLKIEEVALVLQENVNTTKSRLYATLKKLRVQMEEPMEEIKHG
ncbi:RNA polymerase sigma factor [Desulfitobacterium chlororespirans]|uniref:RNA polymerase, sigma-24 subunit, RpoE /RNA polymerase, sigma subunit, SigV n=1 Tax=Desulfitobacterium chlororespirans DSM 11544 TaxID=1121395 RepID=A0A1M7SYZ2_9FIRM|nr:RNA polymerase sigma factor [Desulfitobacterium chlororespirans]SHN63614.1 RNA polymerase, sigma-24 subunit, RpoE /RNA polymerase, sigma subunit, SigV [Desulfitobacterium chlororespirans DSM 11544]